MKLLVEFQNEVVARFAEVLPGETCRWQMCYARWEELEARGVDTTAALANDLNHSTGECTNSMRTRSPGSLRQGWERDN